MSNKAINMLHYPARAEQLESMEAHICKAARLSRALWLAVAGHLESDGDARDQQALYELASELADHASAVRYIFNNKDETRS
jgi:hypothetical protein